MTTGNSTQDKPICHTKQIKMGQMVYEYRRKTKNNSQARVPWLQLKGHWLQQAGFAIDTPVTVRVMEGCLVLTTK
jgi:toxic protein SymE